MVFSFSITYFLIVLSEGIPQCLMSVLLRKLISTFQIKLRLFSAPPLSLHSLEEVNFFISLDRKRTSVTEGIGTGFVYSFYHNYITLGP